MPEIVVNTEGEDRSLLVELICAEYLYMVAVASLRCNTRLKHFYDRLLDNHKPPKVALVAVIRKFLGMIYAIIKNNSFWSDNYCNI